jgi:hypothetical protein
VAPVFGSQDECRVAYMRNKGHDGAKADAHGDEYPACDSSKRHAR